MSTIVSERKPLFHRLRRSTKDNGGVEKTRRRATSVATLNTVRSMEDLGVTTSASIQSGSRSVALMGWLQTSCPSDVLPKILAFCGPQTTSAISRTNKHWKDVVQQEGTWRIMCEELYKWKKGDPEPESWFDLYRMSPCVPIDYSTLPKALSIALDTPAQFSRSRRSAPPTRQVRSVRVLLRPGRYYLKSAIHIKADAGALISIETLSMPENIYRPIRPTNMHIEEEELMEQPLPASRGNRSRSNSISSGKRTPVLRRLFRCNRQDDAEESETEEMDYGDEWTASCGSEHATPLDHAVLVLRSRRHNEPALRVRQGVLQLDNIEIQHNSHGLDIWNGNAAIQIQPPLGEDDVPVPVIPRPTCILNQVQISSKSGRGIVNIDGGLIQLNSCAVRDCAATGVYIGGPGSAAEIAQSDVIRNGVGNRTRRGIARGHSGIYLEQGTATIQQSNISNNTLTGISVVSPDNARITLKQSTLMSNGTYQLELPANGTASRANSVTTDNTMAIRGEPRLRSGLSLTEVLPSTAAPPLLHHPTLGGR